MNSLCEKTKAWELERASWRKGEKESQKNCRASQDEPSRNDTSRTKKSLNYAVLVKECKLTAYHIPGQKRGVFPPFSQNIPLTEMVTLMVERWEDEGLLV
eukprot:Nk52_evm7s256 gene=Nk52_evmTU7s256